MSGQTARGASRRRLNMLPRRRSLGWTSLPPRSPQEFIFGAEMLGSCQKGPVKPEGEACSKECGPDRPDKGKGTNPPATCTQQTAQHESCGVCAQCHAPGGSGDKSCVDDDKCLVGQGEGWSGYTCASAVAEDKTYCTGKYAKDMACCPKACGKCARLPGGGGAKCVVNSKKCPVAKCVAPPKGCVPDRKLLRTKGGECCPKLCAFVDSKGKPCGPNGPVSPEAAPSASPALRALFKKADTDGDGLVRPDELTAALQSKDQGLQLRAALTAAGMKPLYVFGQLDTDGNKAITEKEFAAKLAPVSRDAAPVAAAVTPMCGQATD